MALRPSAPLHPTKPTSEVASHACFIIHSVHQVPQQPTAHRIHPIILVVVVVDENQWSQDWELQLVTWPYIIGYSGFCRSAVGLLGHRGICLVLVKCLWLSLGSRSVFVCSVVL